jgi:hypothetical protein
MINDIKYLYNKYKDTTLTYVIYYGVVTGLIAGLFHWAVN